MARGAGLKQKYELSEELADFMGKDVASRMEVTKALWAYIKKEGLQDEDDGRIIMPDDVLEPIIGSRSINMMKMTGVVSKHFLDKVD